VTGLWIGTGTFVNSCDTPSCQWTGSFGLDITQSDSTVTGLMDITLMEDKTLIAGANCGSTLYAVDSPISNGVVDGSTFTFLGPRGNSWTMEFSQDQMTGVVDNTTAGCNGIKSTEVTALKSDKGEPGGNDLNMTWRVVDICDDNLKVNYRFFDVDNNKQWPDSPAYYTADTLNDSFFNTFTCNANAKICVGGELENGSYKLGVGLNNEQGCLNCCYFCETSEVAFFQFICPS